MDGTGEKRKRDPKTGMLSGNGEKRKHRHDRNGNVYTVGALTGGEDTTSDGGTAGKGDG